MPGKWRYHDIVYKFRQPAALHSKHMSHPVVMQHREDESMPGMTPLHDMASGDAALSDSQIGSAAWLIHAAFLCSRTGRRKQLERTADRCLKQPARRHRNGLTAADDQVIEHAHANQLKGVA